MCQEEKQIEKQRDEVLEAAAADMKATMEKANRRILLYGDEILEESRGVRPLHPIIKAVEASIIINNTSACSLHIFVRELKRKKFLVFSTVRSAKRKWG